MTISLLYTGIPSSLAMPYAWCTEASAPQALVFPTRESANHVGMIFPLNKSTQIKTTWCAGASEFQSPYSKRTNVINN